MPNPNIPQGVLNRLRASLTWATFPALNIIPSFLAPEGIDMTFEGQATAVLPTMTGIVLSPEPYQVVRVMVHLIRSQALADAYKRQQEQTTVLGACTIRTDSSTMSAYLVQNAAITGVNQLTLAGRDVGYVVGIVGVYDVNAQLWP